MTVKTKKRLFYVFRFQSIILGIILILIYNLPSILFTGKYVYWFNISEWIPYTGFKFLIINDDYALPIMFFFWYGVSELFAYQLYFRKKTLLAVKKIFHILLFLPLTIWFFESGYDGIFDIYIYSIAPLMALILYKQAEMDKIDANKKGLKKYFGF